MERKHSIISRRGRRLKQGKRGQGPVVYWMSRDQRIGDNWALLWAQQEAVSRKKGLLVIFCLTQNSLGATKRQFDFMLHGLKDVAADCQRMRIGFALLEDSPRITLPRYLKKIDAHLLVTDFDPLRIKQQMKKHLFTTVVQPIYEVDSHNIIPAWIVSDKKEYGAYTIRPKINRLLGDYLTEYPEIIPHPFDSISKEQPASPEYLDTKTTSTRKRACSWIIPGEKEAVNAAKRFISDKLINYSRDRNNPCLDGQSNLSPYLHFGQLSPQRLALMAHKAPIPEQYKQVFLEELIVRRELADNFCYYEQHYDHVKGFPAWAQKTLEEHRQDKRSHLYTLKQFEEGATHEPLWNSCQHNLLQRGKLHGYLRMYWAKKILEWTKGPEEAMEYAVYLNDRYSLDGCDPNGYTGIAWSIGGVHDRAWKERAVFGKVRYMNEKGCQRKFDVGYYIQQSMT